MIKKHLILLLFLQGILLSCGPTPKAAQQNRVWEAADRQLLRTQLTTSLDSVLEAVHSLNATQWNWQADSNTWSIALVLEHLITHDELFYREVRVISSLPNLPVLPDSEFATDEAIMTYSEITDQNRGKAPVYLAPKGRWCDKETALASYQETRRALIDFVGKTEANLRAYYTQSGRGPTSYRDLHQLLLISAAHTLRHVQQIRAILDHAGFPRENNG
ncbi:MAG: DinB family protein [Saprospiraceae bacterium]|nr:DinB family protein [Saprospiraceae bacterium]